MSMIIRTGFRWTDEHVETLKRLHAAGLSFGEIAKEIGGISRNACIGKAKRLGLPDRLTKRPRKRHIRPGNRILRRVETAMRRVEQAAQHVQEAAEAAANPVHLLDLKSHHCRYPIGEPAEMMFCGATAVKDCSWCAGHYAIVYNRSEEKHGKAHGSDGKAVRPAHRRFSSAA